MNDQSEAQLLRAAMTNTRDALSDQQRRLWQDPEHAPDKASWNRIASLSSALSHLTTAMRRMTVEPVSEKGLFATANMYLIAGLVAGTGVFMLPLSDLALRLALAVGVGHLVMEGCTRATLMALRRRAARAMTHPAGAPTITEVAAHLEVLANADGRHPNTKANLEAARYWLNRAG